MRKTIMGLALIVAPFIINANDLIVKSSTLSVDNAIAKIENGVNIKT